MVRVRLTALLAGLALLSAYLPVAAASPSREPRSDRIPGRFIVRLAQGADAQDVARDHGGRVDHEYSSVLRGFSFDGPDEARDDLRDDPRVAGIAPDYPVQKSVENLPEGVRRIGARDGQNTTAHDLGFTGQGVNIGILDTGIDLDHPDLDVDASLGRVCITSSLNDFDDHGTHIAGTAAALANGRDIAGVAPGATVVPVKVLDDTGGGTTSSIMCGIEHLTRLATDGNTSNDVRIGNMSLNGSIPAGNCNDGGLREAVCRSVAAGVFYVGAAGNEDTNAANFFPGNAPEVMTASAYTELDGRPGGEAGCIALFSRTECDDTLWTRSNFGSAVDITAPGVLVDSLAIGGGQDTKTGTSHAVPHVAGVAALVLGAEPGMSQTQLWNHLLRTGECPDGSQNGRAGPCAGQGAWGSDPDSTTEPLVDALAAVQEFDGTDPDPSPSPSPSPTDCTIEGTDGDDTLSGTGGDDVICGFGGNDTIDAGAGNDVVFGGDGDDTIHGNQGDDEIHGGSGNDLLFGDLGNDTILGDGGDDDVNGGSGNDSITGASGADVLKGSPGDDTIAGGSGNDDLNGGSGRDTLNGGGDVDTAHGGPDADVVAGGPGDDGTLAGDNGDDRVNGGGGNDSSLHGGGGNDEVFGGPGNDRLFGDPGNDDLRGQTGTDFFNGGSGQDTCDAEPNETANGCAHV